MKKYGSEMVRDAEATEHVNDQGLQQVLLHDCPHVFLLHVLLNVLLHAKLAELRDVLADLRNYLGDVLHGFEIDAEATEHANDQGLQQVLLHGRPHVLLHLLELLIACGTLLGVL
eukprot:CAMPEP_0171461014 /NCGR_PEP_ID=MMETSP0945-20130129/5643_1 /TAXON_ID=109269 /ORGANISM="Vaucheria litorea, Strain CCMP2940" /LENGTH=114 /DNA_ID=CAMNT_0011987299 /DNA_START=310 /DNA_END=654 /DNA_ORIENTATION=+